MKAAADRLTLIHTARVEFINLKPDRNMLNFWGGVETTPYPSTCLKPVFLNVNKFLGGGGEGEVCTHKKAIQGD